MYSRSDLMTKLGLQYYIKARNLNGAGLAELATNGIYTYYTRPERTFIKTSNNKTYVYGDYRDDGKYYSVALVPNYEPIDPLTVGNVANIFLYAGETIRYHSRTEVTFADRTAYKYVYVNAEGGREELIIDKYAGFCLKHDGKNAATDGFTEGEAKPSFEVVALRTGNNGKAAVDAVVANAEINGWDTEWFQATGLNLAALKVMSGEFISAEWDHNSSRITDNAAWVAVYNLTSSTPTDKRAKIKEVMKSFYDAGAKYDDSHSQAAFDVAGLYREEWDGSDLTEITFSGRIFGDEGSYSVFILAEYKTDATTPYWQVTFNVSAY